MSSYPGIRRGWRKEIEEKKIILETLSNRNRTKDRKVTEIGDMRVWWVPQIPGDAFNVDVKSIDEAIFTIRLLADYDLYQYATNVKGDYSNVGGLEIYDADGWKEWEDDEGKTIDDIIDEKDQEMV